MLKYGAGVEEFVEVAAAVGRQPVGVAHDPADQALW
jgi:hypothetical protein